MENVRNPEKQEEDGEGLPNPNLVSLPKPQLVLRLTGLRWAVDSGPREQSPCQLAHILQV